MLAFEVSVNGKRLCLASTAVHSVLGVGVTWVKRPEEHIYFNLGGIAADGDTQHTAWRTPALAIGDEVSIRLIDTDVYDQPDETYKPAAQPKK